MSLASFSLYSCSPVVASSSSANAVFAIQARIVRVQNLGSGDFWLQFTSAALGSSGIATTGHIFIGTCTDHRLQEFYFERGMAPTGVSIMATSTAAGTSHRAISVFGEA